MGGLGLVPSEYYMRRSIPLESVEPSKRSSRTREFVEEVMPTLYTVTIGIAVGSKQADVNVHCQRQCLGWIQILGR